MNKTSTPALGLSFLGTPRVTLPDGNSTALETDNAITLLAYLVLSPAYAYRRLELASLLYPDSAEKQALQNLRQTLLRLRRTIGDDQADPPYLLSSTLTIQFNGHSHYWLDVNEFETRLEAVKRHKHRRLEVCQHCMASLAQAVALYRGDFLEGVNLDIDSPLEEWLLGMRDKLYRQTTNALHALANYHFQRGQLDEAEGYALRLLALDALDETALGLQMRVLAIKGRRNQALRMYRDFRWKLADELGVEPEAEMATLAQVIQTGQLSDQIHGRPQRPGTLLTAQQILPPALPNTLSPFLDRETEMDEIEAQLAGRDCRVVTLLGLSGSGKTRLAMRAAAEDAPAWQDGAWLALLDAAPSAQLELALADGLGITTALASEPRLSEHALAQIRAQLYAFLRDKELLFVIDHLEDAEKDASLIKSLLFHAPGVKFILTGCQRLDIDGEYVIRLGGLSYPKEVIGDQEEIELWPTHYSAIQLFAASAKRLCPDFTLSAHNIGDVARICQLVDGLPLGIELAAGWTCIFPCDEIAQRITHSLDFLKTNRKDALARHTSLRAAFEHTWNLLSEAERALLQHLSVLENDFSMEMAINSAGAHPQTLALLQDRALLLRVDDNHFRLHRLMKYYAHPYHPVEATG